MEDEGKRTGKLARKKPGAMNDQMGLGPLAISVPGMVVMNSKPKGGKSHLNRYLVYMNRIKFKHGLVFSKSVFRPGNLDYIPDYDGSPENKKKFLNFRHMRFQEQILRNFLNLQQSYPEEERPVGILIIDDDISSPGMWNCEAMIDAATMYRHYNIVIFISTQYINKIGTTVRECATQVALFKMDSKRSINAAFESYGSDFDDYEQFKRWLESNTTPIEKHQFCWKDKMNDEPWRVCVAPAKIPKFRLDYGRRADMPGCKKVTKKRKRAKSLPLNPFSRGFHGTNANANKCARSGDPHEDSVTLDRAYGDTLD